MDELFLFECSCGFKIKIRPSEFPLYCKCGNISMPPYEEVQDIDPVELDVSNSSLDIMFILNYKSNVNWMFMKSCWEKIFQEYDISCEFINTYNDINYLREYILENRPRLYINTAMLTHERTMSTLVRTYPSVKFLTMNHSSQSDLFKVSTWMGSQNHHLMNMLKYKNCYFGLVDERNFIAQILEHPRIVTLPNVVDLCPERQTKLHDVPVISLACRWDTLKNIPNQILALCLVNKVRPIKVMYCFQKGSNTLIDEIHEVFPLNYEIIPWGDWDRYIKYVEEEIDIGLQVSFTESFNYVAIEHLMNGKPVIGSSAIRYLPYDWQVNIDDVEAIANSILKILDDYDRCSRISRQIAETTTIINNKWFIDSIRRILDEDIVDM